MPKGPIGGPRPFSEYRLIIDPHEGEVKLLKVGPFGGPRPLAKTNPPVSESRIRECALSEAGRSFGAGVVTRGQTTNVSELPPPQRREALELAETWCEGILEATAMEDSSEADVNEVFESVKEDLGVDSIEVEGGQAALEQFS